MARPHNYDKASRTKREEMYLTSLLDASWYVSTACMFALLHIEDGLLLRVQRKEGMSVEVGLRPFGVLTSRV